MLIPIHVLNNHFKLNINGILHIGAHECEELQDYNNIGITNNNIYWIEAMKNKVDLIKNNKKDVNIYNAVIDIEDNKEIVFNITNNGQSSSILEFGSHSVHHPHVKMIEKQVMNTSRMDSIIDKYNIPIHNINFINLDIQGVELRALKSMEKYLKNIQYIYTEVNTEEVYKNCNLMSEIDEYLSNFGFTRVATKILEQYGWGDAFYMKQ
jgi:FkbM family methyltransferase